ncbi:MAG: CDP-diacylglycerol--serine O-phosphatidyltransferase [Planctomycetota bacterium]|nr:CDP-diacylglycerol--serine O-phosphatidyltransferase [Planctomycetota bacterium]
MKPMGMIPSLITLGNAVCGFTAIYEIAHGHYHQAAWLILLAMVFDAFDGKVARMTKQTSDFGAQLDSLSDAISFGIAPAMLVALMNQPSPGMLITYWSKATWFFCLLYTLSTILRLARYNVEAKRGTAEPDTFTGLPSPAAAGMISAIVILSRFITDKIEGPQLGWLSDPAAHQLSALIISVGLPAAALALGYLMVSSRVKYVHVFNRYLSGKRPFHYFTGLIFFVVLVAAVREIALFLGFLAYVSHGPISLLIREIRQPKADMKAAPADPSTRPPGGA